VTTLRVLGEKLHVRLDDQVLAAATGMYGAGGYGAQCGLVEGGLMFIGLVGRERGLADDTIAEVCYAYAEAFEARFGSLLCRELRPEGFGPDNPPHLCEKLTQEAIVFDLAFLRDAMDHVGIGGSDSGGSQRKGSTQVTAA
jgi:hypothetical protein